MAYKDFVNLTALPETDLDELSKQTVMKYASAAARTADAALTAVLREGMLSYLDDLNVYQVYSGAAWSTIGPVHGPWTAFTPTWSGTIGNGTKVGYYSRFGRRIDFRVRVTWGTTTSHPAAVQTLALPFAEHGTDYNLGSALGLASAWDNSAGTTGGLPALVVIQTTGLVEVQIGTTLAAAWSNTQPMTWAVGDLFSVTGTYEANVDA